MIVYKTVCLIFVLSDASNTVSISGVTTGKHDEEKVFFTCSTSPSYPGVDQAGAGESGQDRYISCFVGNEAGR